MTKKFIYTIFISLIWSCTQEQNTIPYPCINGDCNADFFIDPLVSPGVYQDQNEFWHIEYQGFNYFTIKGNTSVLHSDYIVDGTPIIETMFDSDYWVWLDGITFTIPLYSALGYFTGGDFNNPIPIDNKTYTILDMANNFPPLNIVGYTINPNQCLTCENSQALLGTYSKYTYTPQQQIFFDKKMVGDTAKVFMKTSFNSKVEVEKELKIIFD
jgi:hypothetical protein